MPSAQVGPPAAGLEVFPPSTELIPASRLVALAAQPLPMVEAAVVVVVAFMGLATMALITPIHRVRMVAPVMQAPEALLVFMGGWDRPVIMAEMARNTPLQILGTEPHIRAQLQPEVLAAAVVVPVLLAAMAAMAAIMAAVVAVVVLVVALVALALMA